MALVLILGLFVGYCIGYYFGYSAGLKKKQTRRLLDKWKNE